MLQGEGPRIIRAGPISRQARPFRALTCPCYTVLQQPQRHRVTVSQQREPLRVRLLTRTLAGDPMRRFLMLFAAMLCAGCATAVAQPQSSDSDSPPLIAGRVSLAEGDSQIWRAEEDADGNWDTAQINDVVTVGTGLYTGSNGRAEFTVGPNTFRLSSGSRGGFSQLDYGGAVFNLENGSINLSLARPAQRELASVTVDGIRIDLAAPGRYRVDAAGNGGQARVTIFNGQGSVLTGASAINVASGQALVFGPGLSSANFEQATVTAFDQWALNRDDRYRNVQSARYVSPYMTGSEELDFHGDWIPDASYGTVWVPRVVPVGWAPYRHGQWRWVRPWGWTWVDHAPWGYAPFHYGRWVTIGNRWCWWPGGHHARPVWAPALVGFVGGSNISVSVGFGGPVVGWYPLAPWHRFRPHYPHNNTYVTIINQTIVNNPPRGVPPHRNHEGATMVPGPRFRDPVMKVALPVRTSLADLQPMAPPPRNIAQTRKVTDDGMVRRPSQVQPTPQASAPPPASAGSAVPTPSMTNAPTRKDPAPTRVLPPMVAAPISNRGVAPQAPLPGNDPAPLAQPPKFNRVPPTQIQTAPVLQRAAPDIARPQPRARMPQEILPQAEQNPRAAPAEPARFPPGAPPTIRQPKAPSAQAAPPARPPSQHSAAPPRAPQPAAQVEAPRAHPQPAPRAEAPREKVQVVRELTRSKQLQ